MTNTKKIKVLFRHRSMEMGGVEKVLLSMLNNLDRDKFDLQLALNLFQGELRNEIPENIPVKILAGGKEDFPKNKLLNKAAFISRGFKLLLFRKFPWLADRFILHNDADVEIATGYTMFSDVLNSSNKNSKKIGWFHTDVSILRGKPYLPPIIENLKKFDYIIFGGQQVKDALYADYNEADFPPGKVVLNPINTEEIIKKSEAFPVSYDKKTFVSVGRLHARKGFHKLLEAHAALLNEGFSHQIVVIGDGEERERLGERIRELGVTESFILKGTHVNPYPFIKNADYYILPSESEGWPLIIADALILQRPIISTNVGSIFQMLEHGKNGYFVRPDTEEMKEAMKTFLTDQELIEKLRSNLLYSKDQFDNRKIYREVEEIITNLVK